MTWIQNAPITNKKRPLKTINFSREAHQEFTKTLRYRVNEYFKSTNQSKFGNHKMAIKTVFMFSLYFVPYAALYLFPQAPSWVIILLYMSMGLGVAGIGLNVMHDANHGVLSKNRFINALLSYSMNFIGSNAKIWRIQHNVLHHTFTNINHYDEDVENFPLLLRFSPNQKLRKIHRYQYLYAWFFYAQMTLARVLMSDFTKLFSYKKKGLLKNNEFAKELFILFFSKILYFVYIILIPYLVMDISIWTFAIGFVLMHQVAGLILALVFQLAHIKPELEFPEADPNGNVQDSFLVHELKTTANFGTESKFLTWFTGGLNFQIEHHLFTNICHIHYSGVSKIVRETTKEFNLPYHSEKSFLSALINHYFMLKRLGYQN